MYRLRSGKTTSSVSSTRPQSEETHDSAADASVLLSPPILSLQVTSSEVMQMLASQENVSDTELLSVAGVPC